MNDLYPLHTCLSLSHLFLSHLALNLLSSLPTIHTQQARVPLKHVRYLEAHATGAAVGDLIGKYIDSLEIWITSILTYLSMHTYIHAYLQSSRPLPRSSVLPTIEPILYVSLPSRVTLGE